MSGEPVPKSAPEFGLDDCRGRIAENIEHMLTRPLMYCATPDAFESSMMVAFGCWASTFAVYRDPRATWQKVVCGLALKHEVDLGAELFMSRLAAALSASTMPDRSLRRQTEMIAEWMKTVWRRLSCPVTQLGELAG